MRKFYAVRLLSCFIVWACVSVGCHQDPDIPKSAIPLTCQIYQIATVEESVHDTTTFTYDSFGSLTESRFRRWVNDTLMATQIQAYSYDANHYLNVLVDQQTKRGQPTVNYGYTYSYQDGRVQQIVIKNYQSGQVTGYREYAYDTDKLKTYTEKNGRQDVLRQYTFDTSGKLTGYTDDDLSTPAQVTNGKIVSKRFKSGTSVTSTFDNQGQLVSETTSTGSTQTKVDYTYDSEPYWDKTQLRLRGIPSVDLGGHTNLHNLTSVAILQSGGSQVTQSRKLTYRNVYNGARYLLGYARSDGAQQRTIYANCP